jgi:predicted Rossmann fold nucleotide-binding protein DprA/Smf involved in DNA uptake
VRYVESGYTLGIVGARTFTDYSRMERFIREVINEHGLPGQVVSGGARGADSLANTWAMSRGIPMITHLHQLESVWEKGGIH